MQNLCLRDGELQQPRRAKVADLEQVVLVVDHDVVRLEVGVDDVEPLHVLERGEELLRGKEVRRH